jgi:hypothetical protein
MSIAISWWCSPVLTALWVGRHGTGARTPHWWNSPVHYSVISGQMDQCYYTNNTSSLDNIYKGNTNQTMQIYPIKSSVWLKINLKIRVTANKFKSCNLCDNSYYMTSSEDCVYLHRFDLQASDMTMPAVWESDKITLKNALWSEVISLILKKDRHITLVTVYPRGI